MTPQQLENAVMIAANHVLTPGYSLYGSGRNQPRRIFQVSLDGVPTNEYMAYIVRDNYRHAFVFKVDEETPESVMTKMKQGLEGFEKWLSENAPHVLNKQK